MPLKKSIEFVLSLGSLALAPSLTVAQDQFGEVPKNQIVDFARIGADQTEALKINDAIYQGIGFANTFLVVTPGGNVIIDTSSANRASKHHELLTKVSDAPVRYIILTHGHGDHTGGVYLWKGDGTQVLTQATFPELRSYQDRLVGYFNRSNAAQFNFNEERLAELSRAPQNKVDPTITFLDRYDFELGGVKFDVFHTPGETYDALTVWVPKYKAAFVGDLIYDSFPNIYTLRGTQPRWALDYVHSLNKVLALEPEILLPSHGLPITGKDKIRAALTKYRDAIQYVHDATVKGMNEGRDVYTLMREIKLPPELDVGETYGKVSWSVRGIYDGYVGWFDRNPVNMYARSPNAADADLVELAGGAARVADRSQKVTAGGDAVKGLRLADAALAREPDNHAALEAKLAALKALQQKARNGLEHAWLGYGLRGVQKMLDGSSSTPAKETAMQQELSAQRASLFSHRAFSLVAAVLVANLALDFLLLNLMAMVNAGSAASGWSWAIYEGPCTEAFVLGVFFSQVVMLAVWAALFPGSSPLRLLFATVVTIAAAMTFTVQAESLWLQGLFLHRPRGALDSWAVVNSSLDSATVFLLLLYLVQIPFWLLRRAGRMRILFDPSGEAAAPANGPLRLIDLFAATSFLAVPLALGRIMATSDSVSHLFIPVLALSLLMIVFGLPYLWAILGTRHLGIGLVTALVFSEGVAVCGSFVFALLTGNLQPRDWPIVVAAFHATQAATLAMALANGLAARTIGYRLVWATPWRAAAPLTVGGLTSAQPAATQAPQ